MASVDVTSILGDAFGMLKKKPVFLVPLALMAIISIAISFVTAPIIMDMAEDMQLSVYSTALSATSSAQMLTTLYSFMMSILAISSLVILATTILTTLLQSGLLVGLKSHLAGKKSVGASAMLSGAVSKGFHVFAAKIIASLVIFWPLILMVLGGMAALLAGPTVVLILPVTLLVVVAWSIVTLWWMNKTLGLIYLISALLALVLIILAPVSAVFMFIAFIPIMIMVFMMVVWVVLMAMTIEAMVPVSLVFSGKGVIDSAKGAFEFVRKNLSSFAVLLILVIVIAIFVNLPYIAYTAYTQIGSQTQIAPGVALTDFAALKEQMPTMMVIDAIWDFINTAILGTYFLMAFALLYVKVGKPAKAKK